MRILLLGSGGREHALAWKMRQSPLCSKLFIAPGNAGTAQCGQNADLKLNDFEAIHSFCVEEDIDLVVVGPEEPLVNGITDYFEAMNGMPKIPVIGPSMRAAQLEGSKSFAKAFMNRHNIPTAGYRQFDKSDFHECMAYLRQHSLPVVIKADGLAAGKGVLICQEHAEALAEYESMVSENRFGDAGNKVVVEEFLEGIEVSVFVLTDGNHYLVLPEAKDYKKVGEGDTGLNTGGMGAVSPVPFADEEFMRKVDMQVIQPTIEGLKKENIPYTGFLFIGLIKVNNEPYVIEYNCRLGDPETQVVMPLLKNDLVALLADTARQKLNLHEIQTDGRTACTVVAVSGGYPGNYGKGFEIRGLKTVLNADTFIFHAATAPWADAIITTGGRVLCVTSIGNSIKEATDCSLQVLENIHFENKYYRKDIGYEFA
jgi:phosphoribosylamine--glycine ligase